MLVINVLAIKILRDQIKLSLCFSLSLSVSLCLSLSLCRGGPASALSKSATKIILGAQIGVKRTRRSLEIAFYPLAFFFFYMDQQLSIDII